jgi:hypothetical protein
VLASDLPDPAVRIAIAIALHLSVKNGRCDPGHETLGRDTATSARSIRRWAAVLERDGWLAIKRGGRGHHNSYVLLRPMTGHRVAAQEVHMTGQDVAAQTSFPDFDRPDSAHMTGQNPSHDRPPAGRQKAYEQRKEKRREESESPADFAPRQSKKDSRGKKAPSGKTESKPQTPRKKKADDANVAQAQAFARFWAAYPRRVAKEAARKAFESAVEGGVDAEALIAGAQRYAVERGGQEPKYTKHPATWLNKGCWEDEAPGAPVIDESGQLVAYEQPPPQQRQGDRGVAAVAEELAQLIEANGGGWL